MSISSEATEKKYSELYKQHLEKVTKIEELEGQIKQVRAKQNSCRDNVLDTQAEIDALKNSSNDLHITQTQIDIVRQLRSENERLKKTVSDMATAGAGQDLEQIYIQKQRVEDLEAQLEYLKANEPASSAFNPAGSVLESEMAEARAERIDTLERELGVKQGVFSNRCSSLKSNLSRLTELHPVCPEAQVLVDEILKEADSLKE